MTSSAARREGATGSAAVDLSFRKAMDAKDVLPKTALPEEVLGAALGALAEGAVAVVATVVERHGSAPSTPGQKLALVVRRLGDGARSAAAPWSAP
jgi:hypothetical protein